MLSNNQVYQFRVSLQKISPMIWRRILIQSDKTLADLHYVIQIIMGWTNYHLNEFIVYGKAYSIPNAIGMGSPCGHSGRSVKLNDLKFRINQKFLYKYDFTAGWEFHLRLEKILPVKQNGIYPICISGSGASPEEKCGGPRIFSELKDYWAYESFHIMVHYVRELLNENNSDEKLREIIDKDKLREAIYWFNIDKYDRKKANEYLKLYANNDDRWQETFDEVIYL